MYAKYSGLRVNYNKTQIMRLGSLKNADSELITQGTISWSRRIKILGIVFSADKHEMIRINYENVIKKIENIMGSWHSRSLSIIGKIVVINTLVISQLVYCFSSMYTPDEIVFKKIDKIIKNYIWEGKPAKIKYEMLKQQQTKGGVKLCDIRAKNAAIKTKWFKKAIAKNSIWSNYAIERLQLPASMVIECNCNNKDLVKVVEASIWRDAWMAWNVVNYKEEITEPQEIMQQTVWYNSKVKKNGNVMVHNNLMNKGLKKVKDIFNTSTKNIITIEQFKNKFQYDNYLEYWAIILAIPKEWIQKLKNTNFRKLEPALGVNFDKVNFTKENYWAIINKHESKDVAKNYWEKELHTQIIDSSWYKIWQLPFRLSLDTKLQSFQYRLLSCKIITNVKISKWNPEQSSLCYYCKKEPETVTHLFVTCQVIMKLWKALIKWLNYMLQTNVTLNPTLIICNNYQGQYKEAINVILLITKQAIYANRCIKEDLTFMKLMCKIQEYRKIEKIIASKTNKMSVYYRRWDKIE